jgi:hypothetical protein
MLVYEVYSLPVRYDKKWLAVSIPTGSILKWLIKNQSGIVIAYA